MSKASNMAKGGLYTALTILFLYISSIIPINRFYLLGLASCIIPLTILSSTVKNAILVYVSSGFLSLFLGFRGSAIAYIVFFGSYGFIKYYVEKLRKAPLEFILKLSFFNICLGSIYFLYKLFSLGLPKMNLPIYSLVIVAQLAFIIYDYALTIFISYANKKLNHK
jgi:hypothetical protein